MFLLFINLRRYRRRNKNRYECTHACTHSKAAVLHWCCSTLMLFSTYFRSGLELPGRRNNREHQRSKVISHSLNYAVKIITFSPSTFNMSCLRKRSMKALSEMISFWDGRGPSEQKKHTDINEKLQFSPTTAL